MLIHGGCLKILAGMNARGERVDHVISDPPYAPMVHKIGMRSGSSNVAGSIHDRIDLGFEALEPPARLAYCHMCAAVCNGWVVNFCDLESAGDWMRDYEAVGIRPIRVGVWVRVNCTPQFTGDRPGQGAEGIAIGWAGSGKMSWNNGGLPGVWTVPIALPGRGEIRYHPTQKPLELMRQLVRAFTQPREVVLDAYAGSGTTGRACQDTDRQYVLIEQDKKYFETIKNRLRMVGGSQPGLFDATEKGQIKSRSATERGQHELF